jgi:hypothetical protein
MRGAIFAALALGESLSVEILQALNSEDDRARIIVNEQVIQVEQQNFVGRAGNDLHYGGDGNDKIEGINFSNVSNFGKGEIDTVVGLLGIDKFILGDTDWSGYDDGNTALAGYTD